MIQVSVIGPTMPTLVHIIMAFIITRTTVTTRAGITYIQITMVVGAIISICQPIIGHTITTTIGIQGITTITHGTLGTMRGITTIATTPGGYKRGRLT